MSCPLRVGDRAAARRACRDQECHADDEPGTSAGAGSKLRVAGVSPGFVNTNFAESRSDPKVKASRAERMEQIAMPPDAIARAIPNTIEQLAEAYVGHVVVRPAGED